MIGAWVWVWDWVGAGGGVVVAVVEGGCMRACTYAREDPSVSPRLSHATRPNHTQNPTGDRNKVKIGAVTNVQDHAVISTVAALETGFPAKVEIGNQVTIGACLGLVFRERG